MDMKKKKLISEERRKVREREREPEREGAYVTHAVTI